MSKRKKKNKQKSFKTYYISGMHCASCELLVEKKILKQTNAKFADASLGSNLVTIQGGKSLPSAQELTEMFSGDGYGFSDTPQQIESPNNTARYWWAAILIFALFYLLSRSDGGVLAKFTAVDSSSSLAAFFVLGLVASISSCAALVGGLLLSLTKQWHDASIGESATYKLRPHMGFHAGRLGTFVIGGGILGLLGSSLSLNNLTIYAVLISAVSAIMLILGLQMLGVPFAQRMRIALPKSVTARFANVDGTSKAPYVIGAGTFFLPCGFTLIAQGIALTAGSFLSGAAVMGAFALGTLPVLASISYSGLAFTKKPHLTARFQFVAGVLVVVFALYNVNGQLNVLGLPSFNDFGASAGATQNQSANMSVVDGGALSASQQVLQVVAHDFAYTPASSTTLKAGVPTTLIVDNQGVQGCGAFMAARGLWDGWIDLKLGENRKTFTPTKGTYKLTCSMGMVPPVTINVI